MIEERDQLQLHTQCSRFLSCPAFLSSLVSVTLLPWGCPNSPAALMKPLRPDKNLQCKGEDLPCPVLSVSSCCQRHWCHTLWSLSTKSSSLAWEGSMIFPNKLIDLWKKGTGRKISGNSLCISRLEIQSSLEPCGNCPQGCDLKAAFISWQAERRVFIKE